MKILDRYMIQELGGPFAFGLAAFTLLFVAGQLLNIARLVSEEHASIFAAAKYFIYTLPSTLVLTFPMSMLLATLMAMSRLSGDSELTAMRAGGVSVYRIAAPLVGVGLLASIVGLLFQEYVVPGASQRASDILREEIQRSGSAILSNQVVSTRLPNGDLRVTFAQSFDPLAQELHGATVEDFRNDRLVYIFTATRATFSGDKWQFFDGIGYRVGADCCQTISSPVLEVDIGADPSQIAEQHKQPEDMSRAEIGSLLRSGVRAGDTSRYALLQVTYHSKLARPFASLVFTLLAIPLGVRPQRSSSGAGFGISIAIVFAFYVVTTICLAIGRNELNGGASFALAWVPNVTFGAAGVWLMQRAAQV